MIRRLLLPLILLSSNLMLLNWSHLAWAQPAVMEGDSSACESLNRSQPERSPACSVNYISIDENGYVRQAGSMVGQIDSNGYVRSRGGQILGQFDSIGYVRDAAGQIIGRIDGVGYIRDQRDRILARYEPSGFFRIANGLIISTNIPNRSLATVLVFFWLRLDA
jgi:hypothetical protein